jgi:predicted nucleotidyltransferase
MVGLFANATGCLVGDGGVGRREGPDRRGERRPGHNHGVLFEIARRDGPALYSARALAIVILPATEGLMDIGEPITAAEIIGILREHEAALRAAGIRAISLFGSVARGEARANSDIDLAAEFDPTAKMDLIRLIGLERKLRELLGREVQILPEPIRKPRLRAEVERDRVRAF